MRSIFTLVLISVFFVFGCNKTGVPTEFANACAPDNDGKTLEVSGVLQQRGSVFCSSTGGRMECGFDFVESPGSDKKFSADIEQGSGANTVDKLASGYKKEDIKIRDNNGALVGLGADKVKLTGKVSVAPAAPGGQGVCFMQVYKIEK